MSSERKQVKEVRVVHPHERTVEVSSGAMTRHAGISAATAGAEGIYMQVAVIPPHHSATPHWHTNCESAIYVLKGRGMFHVGEGLALAIPIAVGDFLYVPAEAIHQPVNDGEEPLELLVARNTQEEIVVEYDPEAHHIQN